MPHELPQVCLASTSNVGPGTLTRLANEAVSTNRPDSTIVSPIDRAYAALFLVTQLAVQAAGQWQPQHGLILSSSAVAVAEDYFRSVLTECVQVCPVCSDRVAPLETRMEYVFSGSVSDAVRSILDLESFSSAANIRGWAKKIAGSDLRQHHSLDVSLAEFERVCHVRHCAVHSGGYVSTRNASVLGVQAGTWISFDRPDAIHEIISVVTATIRSFNQSLFETLLGCWLDLGVLSGVWAQDRATFAELWGVFRSKRDIESSKSSPASLRANAYHAYQAVHGAVIARRGTR